MGLDMYLTKEIYIGANYKHNKVEGKIELTKDGKPIKVDLSKVTYIKEEAGYWRKANQIHAWFVTNVQDGKDDCGDYYVSQEKMKELLGVCKKIKSSCKLKPAMIKNGQTMKDGQWEDIMEKGKTMTNPEIAAELLPTASGFFFGSTDYNEYYMDDIDQTIEILEAAIKDEEGDFHYHSSW